MYKRKTSAALKLTALLLIVALICPVMACAAEPRASNYLDSYNAYPYAAGGGEVQFWFTVTADKYMDDVGVLSIQIYECSTNSSNINDWGWVDSFSNGNTPSILGHNDYYHSGHVSYDGTVDMWYKAYVCIYAGDETGGDTRYLWTGAVKAT